MCAVHVMRVTTDKYISLNLLIPVLIKSQEEYYMPTQPRLIRLPGSVW